MSADKPLTWVPPVASSAKTLAAFDKTTPLRVRSARSLLGALRDEGDGKSAVTAPLPGLPSAKTTP